MYNDLRMKREKSSIAQIVCIAFEREILDATTEEEFNNSIELRWIVDLVFIMTWGSVNMYEILAHRSDTYLPLQKLTNITQRTQSVADADIV